MITTILETLVSTWKLMLSTNVVLVWFVLTTILMGLYAWVTNHLDMRRLAIYGLTFWILLIGSEGPKLTYISVVLHRSLNDPKVWIEPAYLFTFFTCMMLGLTLGFIVNRALEFFFGDYWLHWANLFYAIGDRCKQRSPSSRSRKLSSWSEIRERAIQNKLEKEGGALDAKAT